MLNKLNFMSNFGAFVFLPIVFRPVFEVVRKKKKLPPLRGVVALKQQYHVAVVFFFRVVSA